METNLQCKVPADLGEVILRADIVLSGKTVALRHLFNLALDYERALPPGSTALPEMKFGADSTESCTLPIDDGIWNSSQSYRLRFKLRKKGEFFLHALKLGGALWQPPQVGGAVIQLRTPGIRAE